MIRLDHPADGSAPLADVDAFRDDLRAVYARLDDEVAALAPVCRVSGLCCRFEEYGHTLFVSGPEFALLLADAPAASRPIDDGASCPWQDRAGRCTAREARPMGCRVYFCDPNYQAALPEIAERGISHLKQMVDERGLPWDYAPLHHHLRRARDEGRLPVVDPFSMTD